MALRREEAEEWAESEEAKAFCARHHISAGVWQAREYTRYTPTDLEPIRDAYKGLKNIQSVLFKARQCPGWIMPRHAPPGLGLESIYPEFRPDKPVLRPGPRTPHYHGSGPCPIWPDPGGALPKNVHRPEDVERHIQRSKDEARWWRLSPDAGPELFPGDHFGVNSEEIHWHVEWAKYNFPEAQRIKVYWPHSHASFKSRPTLQRHLIKRQRQKQHGLDADEWHWHWDSIKDPFESIAKRVDMNPLAVPLFADATRIYLVIEGNVKADATLTAILETGEAASVLSVPSVTLWDCPELERVASRYLSSAREVVICCDADWGETDDDGRLTKPEVVTQARLLQTVLTEWGIHAIVAAPPLEAWRANHELKGLDDHLWNDGKNDGKLEDLEVLDRALSTDLESFIEDRTRDWRQDRARNTARVLRSLSMHAINGQFRASLAKLARVIEPHRNWSPIVGLYREPVPITEEMKTVRRNPNSAVKKLVQRAMGDLEELGAIHIEGNTKIRWNYFSGKDDWATEPPLIVLDLSLAAIESRRKLGK